MVAVLVAVLPIVVATVRAVLDHWQPISDNGVTVVRTLDVFSSHFPFLGYGSSVSNVLPRIVNHPGPLQFILLSPFAQLFGPNAGLAIGTATMNAAAIVIVGWAARRRAGTTGGLLALLVGSLLALVDGQRPARRPVGTPRVDAPALRELHAGVGVADGRSAVTAARGRVLELRGADALSSHTSVPSSADCSRGPWAAPC